MSVVVFGSVNMDLVAQVARLPRAGETIGGHTFFTAPGGKGANQAVACARLGASTKMIGRVGSDDFGAALLAGLAGEGVDVAGVAVDSQASGVAVIAVDDAGENTIIVVPGANGTVGADDLARLDAALDDAHVLLLQLEVPLDAVLAAAHAARRKGVLVMLDPAPAQPLPAELYATIDIVTPNETEAGALVGFPISSTEDSARAATTLLERGVRQVIIKRGAQGIYVARGDDRAYYAAFAVEAIDTVAAGDAFNGALAAALSMGLPHNTALEWGRAAGALATTKPGAQPSLPDRDALNALLTQQAHERVPLDATSG